VLLFRGQQVSDDIQLSFSRRFGPLEITKVGSQGYGTNLNAAQKLLAELLTAATAPGASYLH
jgi:hypothetical protein